MINRFHGPDVEKYIIKFTIIYICIVTLILFFISKSYALSFLIGGAVNIFCFKTTIRTVDHIIQVNGLNARSALVKNNISKLTIYLLVLVLSGLSYKYHKDMEVHLEILPTAFGFLSVKFMIYFKYYIYDKIFKIKNYDDSLPRLTEVIDDKENEGDNDGQSDWVL